MPTQRLQQLFTFLKNSPGDAFILFAIAKEYEGLDDTDNALSYYLQLEKTDADYVGTYYHLGKLYEKLQEFDLAVQTYEKGMTIAKKVGDKHAYGELMGAKDMCD